MPFELVLVEPEPEPELWVAVVAGVEFVVDELFEFDPHAAALSAATTSSRAVSVRMERILIFRCIIAPV